MHIVNEDLRRKFLLKTLLKHLLFEALKKSKNGLKSRYSLICYIMHCTSDTDNFRSSKILRGYNFGQNILDKFTELSLKRLLLWNALQLIFRSFVAQLWKFAFSVTGFPSIPSIPAIFFKFLYFLRSQLF